MRQLAVVRFNNSNTISPFLPKESSWLRHFISQEPRKMLSLSSGKTDKKQSMLCNSTGKLCPNIWVEIFLLRFLTKSWKIHFLVQGSLRPTSPLKGSFRALEGISCGSGGSGVGRSVKRSATSYRRSKNSLIGQIIKY